MMTSIFTDSPHSTSVSRWYDNIGHEAQSVAKWMFLASLPIIGRAIQQYLAQRAAQKLLLREINPSNPSSEEKTLREMVMETRALMEHNTQLREEQHASNDKRFDMLETTMHEHHQQLMQLREEISTQREENLERARRQETRDLQLRKEYRAGIRGLRKLITETFGGRTAAKDG
jgi:hypothetical protein